MNRLISILPYFPIECSVIYQSTHELGQAQIVIKHVGTSSDARLMRLHSYFIPM